MRAFGREHRTTPSASTFRCRPRHRAGRRGYGFAWLRNRTSVDKVNIASANVTLSRPRRQASCADDLQCGIERPPPALETTEITKCHPRGSVLAGPTDPSPWQTGATRRALFACPSPELQERDGELASLAATSIGHTVRISTLQSRAVCEASCPSWPVGLPAGNSPPLRPASRSLRGFVPFLAGGFTRWKLAPRSDQPRAVCEVFRNRLVSGR